MFGIKYRPKELNEENVLKEITAYDIYNYYIDEEVKVGKIMFSPLRPDDKKHPSFGLYVSKITGDLLYNDFVLGSGNTFKFVMELFHVDYWTALNIINNDFNLELDGYNKKIKGKKGTPKITKFIPQKRSAVKISVKDRDWNNDDKIYWTNNYHISLDTLSRLNVKPIEYFWINNYMAKAHKYAYAYHLDPYIYKIYQPSLDRSNGKFYSNIQLNTTWQGYRALDKEADILFITSSMKDVAVLRELKYNAIAPHSEGAKIHKRTIEYLHSRFKNIILFFDYDEAGIKHSKDINEEHGLRTIFTNNDIAKDPSDFAKFYSPGNLKRIINEQL